MMKKNSPVYEQLYLELPLAPPVLITKKEIKDDNSLVIVDLVNDDDFGVIDFNIL